jgi:hypothetical protein
MKPKIDIEKLRETYLGKRIKCIWMNNLHPILPQTKGTVEHIDDMGTLHIKWDNGRILGIRYFHSLLG